jgi:hypothetical protein
VRNHLRIGSWLVEVAPPVELAAGRLMARVMVHPYLGHLVHCTEQRAEDHFARWAGYGHHGDYAMCECGRMVVSCDVCKRMITCCPCGEVHSMECPWPL